MSNEKKENKKHLNYKKKSIREEERLEKWREWRRREGRGGAKWEEGKEIYIGEVHHL